MVSLCAVVYNEVVRGGTGGNDFATGVDTGSFGLAIVLTLAVGAACGLLNAFMINKFNLTPFILTLGTGQIYRSLAYVLCGGVSFTVRVDGMKYIGQGILFGWLPFSVVVFGVLTVITAIIIYRTRFGRHIVATGGNREAARVSGVNTSQTKIFATMIMGTMMAIAAIVLTGRVAVAQPAGGTGMEMDAIAAVVIGGTSLGGGKPNVIGAIFGALILSVIGNTLNLTGVDAFLQWFFKGLIIIVAILLDTVTEGLLARRQLRSSN
jgi:ribose/xylose/arabinose/galactoside ABC-type transport system permease subunit